MGNLNLWEAFAKLGGKAANRLHSMSAMSTDGAAMILSCSPARFAHPARGVLRYEDSLSRDATRPAELQTLGQHLTLARDGNLPIRMIVVGERPETPGKTARSIHVRMDLVGKVVSFDGDKFIVDFVRLEEAPNPAAGRAARRLQG
jgi:hypothetical protein